MDEMLKDARFAHIAKDPKFRRIPKSERKVKIDKRFQSMFKDKQFSVKYTVDKRGRPINQTSSENLRKYYDLSSSEEDEEDNEDGEDKEYKEADEPVAKPKSSKTARNKKADSTKKKDSKTAKGTSTIEEESEDSETKAGSDDALSDAKSEANSDSEADELDANKKQLVIKSKHEKNKITKDVKKKLRDLTVDYARGEAVLLTDSSSEDESSEQEDGNVLKIFTIWVSSLFINLYLDLIDEFIYLLLAYENVIVKNV